MRDFSTIATPLRGIIPPIVTPLLDAETLDVPGLHSLIERLIAGRVHGIFALGSTGEAPSLSLDVRREIIKQSCSAVAGRVPVLINVSENSFVHCLLLTEYSAKAGASAVVWSPPCYFPVPQEDVERNAAALSERAPLPVFLYNVPQYAHNEISPATAGRLSHLANIIGLKNSNGSLDYLAEVKKAVAHRPEFSILVGNEETLYPALCAGADGGVCGGANMFPDLYVRLFEAWSQGLRAEAEALHKLVVHLASAVYSIGAAQTSYLRGLKCALSLLHGMHDVLAEPLKCFSAEERDELKARLAIVREEAGQTR
jgi:4-hydroxy-tetrahydrodipicolinate synthase